MCANIPSMLIQTSRIILHIYTLCNFILCMVLKANMYAKMPKFVNFYAFLQHKIGWIFDIHTKFQECYFISRLDAKLFFIFNTYVNKTLNRILKFDWNSHYIKNNQLNFYLSTLIVLTHDQKGNQTLYILIRLCFTTLSRT